MSERPSHTPLQTRFGLELLKAAGIDSAKVVELAIDFPEPDVVTLSAKVLVTEQVMRQALDAMTRPVGGQSS